MLDINYGERRIPSVNTPLWSGESVRKPRMSIAGQLFKAKAIMYDKYDCLTSHVILLCTTHNIIILYC